MSTSGISSATFSELYVYDPSTNSARNVLSLGSGSSYDDTALSNRVSTLETDAVAQDTLIAGKQDTLVQLATTNQVGILSGNTLRPLRAAGAASLIDNTTEVVIDVIQEAPLSVQAPLALNSATNTLSISLAALEARLTALESNSQITALSAPLSLDASGTLSFDTNNTTFQQTVKSAPSYSQFFCAGSVSGSTGTILSSRGANSFTCVRSGTGQYDITFGVAHPGTPIVVCQSQDYHDFNRVLATPSQGNLTSAGMRIYLRSSSNSPADGFFSFIVL